MHTVEPANNKVIDHIDDRFGHVAVVVLVNGNFFETVHAFLDQYPVDAQAFLARAHAGSLLAVELGDIFRRLRGHHAHAVRARIRLDDDERFFLDLMFVVLGLDFSQKLLNLRLQAIFALAFEEIDVPAIAHQGGQIPGVEVNGSAKLLGQVLIDREMLEF